MASNSFKHGTHQVAQKAKTYNLSFSLKSFFTLNVWLVLFTKFTLGICFWEKEDQVVNNTKESSSVFFMNKILNCEK